MSDIQEYRLEQEDIEAKKGYSRSALAKRNNVTDSLVDNGVDKIIFGSRFAAWII